MTSIGIGWRCPYCNGLMVVHNEPVTFQGNQHKTYKCDSCKRIGLPMWLSIRQDSNGQLFLEMGDSAQLTTKHDG